MERESRLDEISAGCLKKACECFLEARAVLHKNCNKSDKRRDGNKPEWGQVISLVLRAGRAATDVKIIKTASMSGGETPLQ